MSRKIGQFWFNPSQVKINRRWQWRWFLDGLFFRLKTADQIEAEVRQFCEEIEAAGGRSKRER